jgi:uncharacterized protein
MLLISQLRLPIDHDERSLMMACAKGIGVSPDELLNWSVVKRATDARRGSVEFSYTLHVEVKDEARALRAGKPNVMVAPVDDYAGLPNDPVTVPERRPVIVGTGPCGLFCGLILARYGFKPILLERGKAAGDRARDVTGFWRRGWAFNADSNVQFGEGGAGTFSDGKLYTQIRDRENRIPWLLKEMVKAGAPEDILTKSRPHIGTDRLIKVVRHIREEIISLGGEVRFDSAVADVTVEGGRMTAVKLRDGTVIDGGPFIFAVGHSSRDTFEMLHTRGIPFDRKPFSIGVRIEHPQGFIDRSQYGKWAGNERLGAAAYKFVAHCTTGRSAYSFCMCPGGLVVAAASEPGHLVSNGMSSYARAESNANSGFMVEVTEKDFCGDSPLAGMELQRAVEKKAFELGGSNYHAPAQRLEDFMKDRASTGPGSVIPSYQPGVVWTDLRQCLPDYVVKTMKEAIMVVDKQIPGYAHPDAVLTGVETRSSSPVRIPRDPETLECAGVADFFPAGEGAGYAGGIISAAVDGLRVAEHLLRQSIKV